MAAKKTKKTAVKKTKPKTSKNIQHCKKCGERGHNARRHKAKAATKKPAKK